MPFQISKAYHTPFLPRMATSLLIHYLLMFHFEKNIRTLFHTLCYFKREKVPFPDKRPLLKYHK